MGRGSARRRWFGRLPACWILAALFLATACGTSGTQGGPSQDAAGQAADGQAPSGQEAGDSYDASCLADCPLSMPALLEPACPALVTNWQETGDCEVWCESPGLPLACTRLFVVQTVPGVCHVDIT